MLPNLPLSLLDPFIVADDVFCRSIPTLDRISDLPESILSHILSFMPIKFAATTSVLSKRWKPVWLSLFILNFDDKAFKDFDTFRKFVYSTLFSLRDKKTSIQSFTLTLGDSSRFQQREFNRIFKFVMQRGVENINFNLFTKQRCIKLPPGILSCKTLQVLRLENIKMWDFDKVDFPCLKTLYLNKVDFKSPKYFAKFLCGCPILEDLDAGSHIWLNSLDSVENLNALPNLVNTRIRYDMYNLMTLVCNTRILHLEQLRGMRGKTLPMFHNLTHMELAFYHSYHSSLEETGECSPLIEILPHFPNLQHLSAKNVCFECLKVSPNPTIAPECLLSQLKTFRIGCYTGIACDFNFVKYIMEHSKVLETVTIRTFGLEKNQLFMKLSSCTRSSAKCQLLFD